MTVWIYSAPCHCLPGDCRILECVSHIHSGYLYAWLGLSVITTAAAAVFEESGLLKWMMVMVSKALEKQNSVLLQNPGGCRKKWCWYSTQEHGQLCAAPAVPSLQSGVRNRDISPLVSPCLPHTAHSPDQSSLLSQTTDRPLKSEKQGWEVEDESTAGKKVIRQLEVSLGNKI